MLWQKSDKIFPQHTWLLTHPEATTTEKQLINHETLFHFNTIFQLIVNLLSRFDFFLWNHIYVCFFSIQKNYIYLWIDLQSNVLQISQFTQRKVGVWHITATRGNLAIFNRAPLLLLFVPPVAKKENNFCPTYGVVSQTQPVIG